MHKACRLVTGIKSVACAQGQIASHESCAAEPNCPISLHQQPTQDAAGPKAPFFTNADSNHAASGFGVQRSYISPRQMFSVVRKQFGLSGLAFCSQMVYNAVHQPILGYVQRSEPTCAL